MYSFKNIIDDIEANLDTEIDVSRLAKLSAMSLYEFRRVFSFVAGISIAEYVRKRRLSLAAIELYSGKGNVTELSAKYGYDSPSSFSRAFKEFHGFSPSEAMNARNDFKLFTKLDTEIVVKGGKNISYTVFSSQELEIHGFSGHSDLADTECCEKVWEDFYESDISKELCKGEKLFAVYTNTHDGVMCLIGSDACSCGDTVKIPESEWVSFKLCSTEDGYVNSFYNDVITGWLASSGYKKRENFPNIEVFPSDMSEDGFEWEIRIAVEK